MLEIGLNAQVELVHRLKDLQQNTALSADSFELYKRWETKGDVIACLHPTPVLLISFHSNKLDGMRQYFGL
jgi:hypothetical protein